MLINKYNFVYNKKKSSSILCSKRERSLWPTGFRRSLRISHQRPRKWAICVQPFFFFFTVAVVRSANRTGSSTSSSIVGLQGGGNLALPLPQLSVVCAKVTVLFWNRV